MTNLLNDILIEHQFVATNYESGISFYSSSNERKSDYYLVAYIEEDNLKAYLSGPKIEAVLNAFNNEKAKRQDIDKNTSLLLCVKTPNIKDGFLVHKNNIYQIEEDEYWFKKYVIVYTERSVREVGSPQNKTSALTDILNNIEHFKNFKEDLFSNELYFLAVQLFLKLPFLKIPIQSKANFITVETILADQLSTTQLKLLKSLSADEALFDQNYLDKVKEIGTSIAVSDHEMLNQLINKFNLNA